MSRKLEGKIAVVTGGTTGIGFAAAKRFADEGAQVVIPAMAKIIRDCTLLGELGEPDDVANLAVFLVSKRSKFITAQVIQCDGGTFDHNPARYGLRNLSIEGKALRPVDSE